MLLLCIYIYDSSNDIYIYIYHSNELYIYDSLDWIMPHATISYTLFIYSYLNEEENEINLKTEGRRSRENGMFKRLPYIS